MIYNKYKKVHINKNYGILCFDYGTKYIGVAVGCLKTKIVKSLPVLCAKNINYKKHNITKLCAAYNIGLIILGVSTKKNCPEMLKKVNIFYSNLLFCGLPIHLEDETFTTKLIRKNCKKKNTLYIHGTSACLILQMWLNRVKNYT